MRHFHSYGPVDCEEHFCLARRELVDACFRQLMGNPEKGGHFFTIWAPRQTGKTWLMRETEKKIGEIYGGQFMTVKMSCQGIILENDDPVDAFLQKVPKLILDSLDRDIKAPVSWEEWMLLFHKRLGIFEKPVILFIDEFDSLPPKVIDRLVTLFRDMYLNRESYCLHGLALIGVRAVLGVESLRGSPFNIQRSLHVPNFTYEETLELFRQYQEESSQKIDPAVVKKLHESLRGQPGLVCWFGELLTEKFNPGKDRTIGMEEWSLVWRKALYTEWNNTVLNLVKKAKNLYQKEVLDLFCHSDIQFSMDANWCAYLYLNGLISSETVRDEKGENIEVCRFSCPFIQIRLYNALTGELIGDRLPILALHPLDELSDVFDSDKLNIPALLNRYKDYLKRLKEKGLNPWKDQPRRTDLHLTEAVGHFHLYFWLQNAVGRICSVSPEFPTGNGKVDLHLKCGEKQALIEVKSFTDAARAKAGRTQAAHYAKKCGLNTVTLVLFVPVEDEDILQKLSGEWETDGIQVSVCAIGWT
ncbi:MAG: AAA-like domain-containing protein [Desulfococcaceae bacterium]